jgi:hypothetical protein
MSSEAPDPTVAVATVATLVPAAVAIGTSLPRIEFKDPTESGLGWTSATAVTLNDLSDEQLKAKLSQSKLGKRRASIAKAVLRRRRADRIRKWLQRNPWLAFLIGALGLAGVLLPKLKS